MHQKLAKHGRFRKQNNQLPTKSHDELEDNSNEEDIHMRSKNHEANDYRHHLDLLIILLIFLREVSGEERIPNNMRLPPCMCDELFSDSFLVRIDCESFVVAFFFFFIEYQKSKSFGATVESLLIDSYTMAYKFIASICL